jgi:hypothetical protein
MIINVFREGWRYRKEKRWAKRNGRHPQDAEKDGRPKVRIPTSNGCSEATLPPKRGIYGAGGVLEDNVLHLYKNRLMVLRE